MIDPGRLFAEAIYFLQYTVAQIMWAINRATLSIAVIAESINSWVTDNVGYFVELLVNALSAPLGGMFILALTALGFWYALNSVVATERWVDPSKLFSYGLIAFFFFSSPIVVIELMEELRTALNGGIDTVLIDGAAGDIFDTDMDGTDSGLPGAIPDVNSDGVVGSFDLVTAFMLVANIDELDSSEFPVDFEDEFFPYGDPSSIDLSDEADQEEAKALANDGIERLFFALVAIPTAIAEHFLRLSLTGVAIFLYAGVPFAMLFAFFIYTQAFLGAYLKQYINLLIETLMSVIITAIMISLLAAAAQQGTGLYIGASLMVLIVLLWRIKSALKLASAAFELFGGAAITGGVGGMALAHMGKQTAVGAVGLAGAAVTGGVTLAAGGAVLATAAAVQADGRNEGAYLGMDPNKSDGRTRQLKAMAGYALGKVETARSLIEGGHEARTLLRNFRDGEAEPHDPDMLDYLRAGSSMSGFGSSPWLAMRFSPSLRAAYDEIGGRRVGTGVRDASFDGDGEPVDLLGETIGNGVRGNGRFSSNQQPSAPADDDINDIWREEPATPRQLAYLNQLGVEPSEGLTRGQASDLINQARPQQRPQSNATRSSVTSGQSQPLNQALATRFATLEQALVTLTDALTNPGGNSRFANGPRAGQGDEIMHGPIPDWLQNPDTLAVQPQIVPITDEFPDTTKAEGQSVNINTPTPDSSISAARLRRGTNSPRSNGTVHLAAINESRQQALATAIDRLQEPDSASGQAAHRTLVVHNGQPNADLLQAAVTQHSATAVQEATIATAELVAQYQADGMDEAAILAAFQSGEATGAIRETAETPLSEAQLSAVADMILLPQRHLTRTELIDVIGQQVAAGATDEQAVVQALGSPVGFGGQTGTVRGVMAGALEMNLSPDELARLAELIRDGLQQAAQEELVGRGHPPTQARTLVNDITALPGAIIMPQSTAVSTNIASTAEERRGTAVSPQQPLNESGDPHA